MFGDCVSVFCLTKIQMIPFFSGDFELLSYSVYGSDTNITVVELTKGRSNMDTFTLLWGGVPSKPIPVSANETEVCCGKKNLICKTCFKALFYQEQ